MRWNAKALQINLPFGLGGVSLDLSEEAARAAWSLYVELGTRIATEPLAKGRGSVREALGSLHALFGVTRSILREGGLELGRAEPGQESLGSLALRILNEGLRPHLARWHASFSAHEAACWRAWLESGKPLPVHPGAAAALVDESAWDGYDAFFGELAEVQRGLGEYVALLRRLAGCSD